MAHPYTRDVRDITLPPSPERGRKTLRTLVVLRGVAAAALTAVLVWMIAAADTPVRVLVAVSALLLFDVLWFTWGLQELRRAGRQD